MARTGVINNSAKSGQQLLRGHVALMNARQPAANACLPGQLGQMCQEQSSRAPALPFIDKHNGDLRQFRIGFGANASRYPDAVAFPPVRIQGHKNQSDVVHKIAVREVVQFLVGEPFAMVKKPVGIPLRGKAPQPTGERRTILRADRTGYRPGTITQGDMAGFQGYDGFGHGKNQSHQAVSHHAESGLCEDLLSAVGPTRVAPSGHPANFL